MCIIKHRLWMCHGKGRGWGGESKGFERNQRRRPSSLSLPPSSPHPNPHPALDDSCLEGPSWRPRGLQGSATCGAVRINTRGRRRSKTVHGCRRRAQARPVNTSSFREAVPFPLSLLPCPLPSPLTVKTSPWGDGVRHNDDCILSPKRPKKLFGW